MEENFKSIRSSQNSKVRIKILEGHFATTYSHINTYIDMSTVKGRHINARETARELAVAYVNSTAVDTIVCLDGMEIVGAFMAEYLADNRTMALNSGKNISLITPEFNQAGQMFFRDNTQRMVRNMQVLLLVASATTGRTVKQAIECIEYYQGTVCGISAIFSAAGKAYGLEINSLFTCTDIPQYQTFLPGDCPFCKQKMKVDAIVNSYGYSKL